MSIYLYTSGVSAVEMLFANYDKAVKAVFKGAGDMYDELKDAKAKLDAKLSALNPVLTLTEDQYDRDISHEETKMLLMNGLYTKHAATELLERQSVSAELRQTIIPKLNILPNDAKVLFWNA